jgi:WD40 repeat protein
MSDYGRNIESFCVIPNEERLVAGTLLGRLLVVNVDSFAVEREYDAHAGMIIAVDAHPSLPYICALGVDHFASVWTHDSSGHLSLVFQANLRLPRPENEHNFPPVTSVSQAIAFHPTERRLLTRTANGAVAEIEFDHERFDFTWCRSFFVGFETGYLRYLVEGDRIFVASADGTAGIFDPKQRDQCILSYRYNHEQIHAAEHVEGPHYLLPSDSRRVIRLDVTGEKPPVVGPAIVRDHLERVDYNRKSKRAFISSFDRCIYEVCPETGQLVGLVARTPMKCRWLKTLERDPTILIVQCRNGALYKINVERREVTGVLKETPNALWCGARFGDGILLAGDGSEVLKLIPAGAPCESRQNLLNAEWVDVGYDPGFYTKRLAVQASESAPLEPVAFLARTDGKIHGWNGSRIWELADLGSPLRDIAAGPAGDELFAVTEDGTAHCVDSKSGKVRRTFHSPKGEPLWSLAYNHERGLLAVAEREGSLYLLDAATFSVEGEIPGIRRSKRARWLDQDHLLTVSLSELREVDLNLQTVNVLIPSQRNTIEDFSWSLDKKYLVVVTYAQDVTLFDLTTRTFMHSVSFDMHYPKGIEWIPPRENAYRYEFLVWGRSGKARQYRVHGARIISLGSPTDRLSRVDQRAGVVAL